MTSVDLELSLLIIGDSGTGKTEFIKQLPDPFVFDFDKGMIGIANVVPNLRDPAHKDSKRGYMTFRDVIRAKGGGTAGRAMPDRGIFEFGVAWKEFILQLNRIGESIDKGTCPYKSICFDSLSIMQELCMNNILKNDSEHGGGPPQIQHWGAQISALKSIMDQLTAWPLIKYVTAHVQRDTNDITKTVEKLPLVTGKLAGMIGVYFDEIYFADADGSGANRKYFYLTEANPTMRQARTRRKVPDKSVQDWNILKKYYVPT